MSEADVETPPGDSAKSPGSTLDNFSREDLVRFIKKQTLVLQKTRSQCESLKKEVVNYKASKSNNGNSVESKDFKGLQEQVRMLEEDKEEMKKAYNSAIAEKEATLTQYQDIERKHKEILESYNELEKEVSLLKNKKKELDEQNECLQMKNETLSTSYHFMQEEQEKIVLENKELKDQINVLTSARDETLLSLKELKSQCSKNSEIEDLSEQCEELEAKVKSAESESEVVGDLDEKLSSLKESLKEKDDLNTKLKALAVKSKKQVEELKHQMEKLKEEKLAIEKKMKASYEKLCRVENQNIESGILSTNYAVEDSSECLQQEYDKLHDNWEDEKVKCQKLEKDLQQTVSELTDLKLKHISLKEDKDKVNQQLEAMMTENKSLENKITEINSKVNLLEKDKDSQRIQKEEILKEKNEIAAKVHELENQLEAVNEEKSKSLNKLQEQLQTAKIEATQNSMMDLEIADYERTVKSLQDQLGEKENKITELTIDVKHCEEHVKTLQKEVDYVDEQKVQAEDRSQKLKQLLMKAKKDLADSKRLENEQKTCEAQLRGQLEHFTQQMEECKLQMSETSVENHSLEERLKSTTEMHQRSMKIQEKQVQSLQQQLEDVQAQLNSVQNEYEGYKVRVHSVLKQQKHKMSSNDVNSVEKQEREQQDRFIEQLKAKIQELNTNWSVSRQENETLQEEHDRLLMRHNKLLEDFQDRETLFKANLENLNKQNSSKTLELSETVQQLTYQKELLMSQFKDQIKFLKMDHDKTVALLQNQTESSEKEIYRLQKELQLQQQQQQQLQLPLQPSMATVQFVSKPSDRDRDPSDSPSDISSDILRHEERQQGEGMEFVDTESFPRGNSNPGLSTLVSFEQLLTQPEPDVVKPPVFNEEELKANYDSAQKRSDHLAQLLNESEATVMRLTEQAKILKEEIRRLERNHEREKESANLEYLKNIFLKFVMLKAGDERQMLIPVICTMLKLSPEEKTQLTAIAQGDSAPPPGSNTTGAWGSYLHRWSGIM